MSATASLMAAYVKLTALPIVLAGSHEQKMQNYEGANEIQALVIARQMLKQASERDPIWPESMPGAEGIASGENAPSPEEQREQERATA